MQTSIIIAAHNEGDLLPNTVRSIAEVMDFDGDWEIVILDDASTDESVQRAQALSSNVVVKRYDSRLGCPKAKHFGALEARGEVLIFLDGHCKPEPCSLERMVKSVKEVGDTAVITPRIPSLNPDSWQNDMGFVGHGFYFDLEDMSCHWRGLGNLKPKGRFFETPAAVGCCLAMSRNLYLSTGGFDQDMVEWGIEDIDFSFRVWLLGLEILHDPAPIIGHRFRSGFDNYSVLPESVIANQIRMARKNFADKSWNAWNEKLKDRLPAESWEKAWQVYKENEASAEEQREKILTKRKMDELEYAERFGLDWPK